MDIIQEVIQKQKAVEHLKDHHSLYLEGEWFGTLNDPFAPEFTLEWEDSGYANVMANTTNTALSLIPGKGGKVQKFIKGVAKAGKEGGRYSGIIAGESGLMKKKLFKSSGFFSWSANVRIVDWNGSGLVLERWEKLSKMALPSISVSDDSVVASSVVKLASTLQGKIGDSIDSDTMAGVMARNITRAPKPVHMKISDYINTNSNSSVMSMRMVIDAIGCTFSVERTENGPIYADFNITLSSTEPVIAETNPVRYSRVKVKDGEA